MLLICYFDSLSAKKSTRYVQWHDSKMTVHGRPAWVWFNLFYAASPSMPHYALHPVHPTKMLTFTSMQMPLMAKPMA